ncbi:TPA: hypothetical protein ACSTJE_003865 [Serratia fonticola]
MLKFLLFFLNYIIAVYFIGDRIRLNPKVDNMIRVIEGRYSELNLFLENTTVKEGLLFLRKVYGLLSILIFCIIVLIAKIGILSDELIVYTFPIFLLIFMGWFSIQWITEHKKIVLENYLMGVMIVLAPIGFGLLDYFADTNFMKILIGPIFSEINRLGIPLPSDVSAITSGGIISFLLFLFFAFYYLLSWVMITPFLIISLVVVITPIALARFFSVMDKSDTFLWFSIFLFFVTGACLVVI